VYVTWVGTVVDVAGVVVVVAVPTSTLKNHDLKRHNKSNPTPKKNSKEKKTNPQRDQKGRKTHSHESIDLGQVQLFLPLLDELPFLTRGAGDLP
jgi:hypothetical protein